MDAALASLRFTITSGLRAYELPRALRRNPGRITSAYTAPAQNPARCAHHANTLHLVGNLLFLLIFGLPAERSLGAWRFLLLFLAGVPISTAAARLAIAPPARAIIGASGGVSAVIGAYLALFPTARLGVVVPLGVWLEFIRVPAALLISLWAALQLAFTFVGPTFGAVAWWAHLAGFCAGAVYALVMRPGLRRRARGSS